MRFILDNSILLCLSLTDVEKYAGFLYGLTEIVTQLEMEQEEKGVGMQFEKKPTDQNFYYNYI